jgi:hypothetical protein
MAEKQGEQPGILGAPCSISLHKQALGVFEPEACVARAVIVFDPRYVLVPEISVRHSTLLSGDECNPQAHFSYSAGDSDDCKVNSHFSQILLQHS